MQKKPRVISRQPEWGTHGTQDGVSESQISNEVKKTDTATHVLRQ